MAAMVPVREADKSDWKAIWPIYRQVVEAGDTYAIDPSTTEEEARREWMLEPPALVLVAETDDDIAGTANAYANRPGPGAHVASASFMVDRRYRGEGVGRALAERVIVWARSEGFKAIQFNCVVETNQAAVTLWRAMGFSIIGTVPEAFAHPDEGLVGLHLMHRKL